METLDQHSIEKMSILPIKDRWNLLAVGVGISLISIVYQIFEAVKMNGLLRRIEQGDMGAAFEIERIQKEGVTPIKALMFLVAVAAIVFICMWFYRAAQNVHQAGMKFLNYTPGWNVGWFFIPLAHIVMPAIVIRETVKASQSINNRDEYSSWANNKVLPMFAVWSICFSVRLLVGYATVVYGMSFMSEIAAGHSEAILKLFKNTVWISYASVAISIVELVALFLFSKKVTELQEEYRKD